MASGNPYAVLGLRFEDNPSAAAISSAYRRLALLHHPDKVPGSDDAFQCIVQAYELLSSPSRRQQINDALATAAARQEVLARQQNRRQMLLAELEEREALAVGATARSFTGAEGAATGSDLRTAEYLTTVENRRFAIGVAKEMAEKVSRASAPALQSAPPRSNCQWYHGIRFLLTPVSAPSSGQWTDQIVAALVRSAFASFGAIADVAVRLPADRCIEGKPGDWASEALPSEITVVFAARPAVRGILLFPWADALTSVRMSRMHPVCIPVAGTGTLLEQSEPLPAAHFFDAVADYETFVHRLVLSHHPRETTD